MRSEPAPRLLLPLTQRNFKLYYGASVLSMVGSQLTLIAFPWFVLKVTGDPAAMGLVLAVEGIPRAAFMIFGGAFTDRFSPRTVLALSSVSRAGVMLALGALTLSGFVSTPLIFVAALAFGILDAFAFPASSAFLPRLLETSQLPAGNALVQGVGQLSTMVGPAAAGFITVAADDPRLTPRLVPPGREPTRRILLLPEADLHDDAAVLEEIERHPVHVFCLDTTPEAALERLEATGVHVHPVPADQGDAGLVDLRAVLSRSHELGMDAILCEGGADLSANLLREGLVDRLYLLVAPRALGGAGLPAFAHDADRVAWDRYLPACAPTSVGSDTLITLDRSVG